MWSPRPGAISADARIGLCCLHCKVRGEHRQVVTRRCATMLPCVPNGILPRNRLFELAASLTVEGRSYTVGQAEPRETGPLNRQAGPQG